MESPRVRVLVVDDERFFREAICDALAGEDVDLELASTAGEALEQIGTGGFAVVVLDIRLPDRSGIDVLRELRAREDETRVVVLSAHTEQESVLEALRLGACDYLAKPLHEEELRLSVRRAAQTHRIVAEAAALRRRAEAVSRALATCRESDPEDRTERSRAAVEEIAHALGVSKTSLMSLDASGENLCVEAAFGGKRTPENLDPVAFGEGVAGWVAARGESLWVQDVAADPRFADRVGSGRYETGSFAVVPLHHAQATWGVLCAADRQDGGALSGADRALLELFAGGLEPWLAPVGPDPSPESPSPPWDDAERVAELAREVCDAITREVEPDRLLGGVLRVVGERLAASPVSLYLLDASTGDLLRESQWEGAGAPDRPWLARGRGLSGAAFETGQPVATAAPEEDPRFDAEVDTPEGGGSGALLLVPIRFRGKVLGCLRLFPADAACATARVAEVLGASVSAAVRNVLLYRSLVDSIEEVARARREGKAPAP